ncbi:hypothetical protein J6590_012149 [Homalodisca vitripennis]|nr:hypothetical protein J6590_012149 [Homalodisca vitripennis]
MMDEIWERNIDTAKFKTVKRRRKRRNSTKKTDKKNLQFGNCLSSSTTLSKTRFNISIFGDNHAKGLSRAWGREQDETLDDAVAADQQQTHLSRVLNDAGEDHSLLNATPEPTSVTLQFDSYADVVRSSSETVVER